MSWKNKFFFRNGLICGIQIAIIVMTKVMIYDSDDYYNISDCHAESSCHAMEERRLELLWCTMEIVLLSSCGVVTL